jgi:hypothetical protein
MFSFSRLVGADPMLGVEMASTGEVGCFGDDLHEALVHALLATGFKVPRKGALLSLGPLTDKYWFADEARVLSEQPARAHFDPRAPSKPLIPTTGATRSRTSSTSIQWRPVSARSWPTERNGREAHPTFCWRAPMLPAIPWLGTGLAGQTIRAHSLAGCAAHRPSCARSGLRLSSAVRDGWERGRSR